jgi:hypothetical protein
MIECARHCRIASSSWRRTLSSSLGVTVMGSIVSLLTENLHVFSIAKDSLRRTPCLVGRPPASAPARLCFAIPASRNAHPQSLCNPEWVEARCLIVDDNMRFLDAHGLLSSARESRSSRPRRRPPRRCSGPRRYAPTLSWWTSASGTRVASSSPAGSSTISALASC